MRRLTESVLAHPGAQAWETVVDRHAGASIRMFTFPRKSRLDPPTDGAQRCGSSSRSSWVPSRRCQASSSADTGRKIRSAASQIDFENG